MAFVPVRLHHHHSFRRSALIKRQKQDNFKAFLPENNINTSKIMDPICCALIARGKWDGRELSIALKIMYILSNLNMANGNSFS